MKPEEEEALRPRKANIYSLGLVSLFTDASTEMVYPLLPDLVRHLVRVVGSEALALGAVEGVAEATASVMKAVSGYFSDRWRRRKLPVFLGYLISGMAKPLLALAGSWPVLLLIRFWDRMGKGIRTSPRDALLADSAPPEALGTSFGLHRAMDTMGAVLGPLIAFLLLYALEIKFTYIFFVAAAPAGLALLVIILAVREVPPRRKKEKRFRLSWSGLSPAFQRFVVVSGVFSLGHFPAAFLVLRCRELGVSMEMVTLVYLLYNLVYSLAALPAGRISDKVGRRKTLIFAYFLFAAVFAGGAFAQEWWHGVLVFMGYGIFQGIYEGGHRAFCADLEPSERRASSYGVLHAVIGGATLPAGLIAGALWTWAGAAAAFVFASLLALCAGVIFILLIPRNLGNVPGSSSS